MAQRHAGETVSTNRKDVAKNKQMIIRGGVLQLKQMFCDTSIYEQGWDSGRSENRRITLTEEGAILIANCDKYRKKSDI